MSEHILFVTGKLAEKTAHRVLQDMQPTEFSYHIHNLGINVAGLMTTDMVKRRLTETFGADRIVLPGRCRGDIDALSEHFGIPVERGPDELKDLASMFGKQATKPDLNRYDTLIFAEIVDAPNMQIEDILKVAERYTRDGANVIDIGCLPNTKFPHLAECIRALKQQGYTVSIDSLAPKDLLSGCRAGADYMLSLKEDTLWIAEESEATPILIPMTPDDQDSLYRCIDSMQNMDRRFLADAILDPIHFGFTHSIVRFHALRQRYADIEIMMGIGNLTELTHADTAGINAMLFGIISEMNISAVLATEVSDHCRRAVREADLARRIMYAARDESALPQYFSEDLMALHERKPFPYNSDEIREMADAIRDPNFRVQIAEEGIYIFNRDGLNTATDPFELYPHLNVDDDGPHAFYLGVETARAQIAWQLGKRYNQDEELEWGCAVDKKEQDLMTHEKEGATLRAAREKKRRKRK